MRRENFLRSLPKGSEMVGKAVDILENCWLLLPDRRVGKGDVRIAGGKIAEIIARDCCPDRLDMPGLVNCHGHTAMTLVRRISLTMRMGATPRAGLRALRLTRSSSSMVLPRRRL